MDYNIAVLGVVYPASLKFLSEYMKSIDDQSFQNFNLYLFGHGVEKTELNLNFSDYKFDISFKPVSSELSIPKVRELGIKFIKADGSDVCIFTDTDDFFEGQYVSSLKNSIINKNKDIVFSDISLYYEDSNHIIKNYLRDQVPNNFEVDFILEKNCLGLSNTGIDLNIFDQYLNFPNDIKAVDWWFFTFTMNKEKIKANFVNDTCVYYRQYENNLAGFLNLNKQSIERGIEIKKIHYKNLRNFGNTYDKLYSSFKELENLYKRDMSFRENYTKKILEKFKNEKYLWWEPIILPESFQK